MTSRFKMSLASALLASTIMIVPASAQSLLGIVGDKDSGALVTIGSGSAGDSGLVNVGLGGGGGNVADVNVGNAATANVSSGGSNGVLGVDADVLSGAVTANASVGGSNGLVDANAGVLGTTVTATIGGSNGLIDIGIGTGGGGGGGNGGGGNGGGGNGGGGGGGGGGNGGGGGGGGGNPLIPSTGGGGGNSFFGSIDPGCEGIDPNQIVRLFDRTNLSGWTRASNIQIVPVKLCPTAKRQVAGFLSTSGKFGQLQGAVVSDPLVAAALSRTRYNAGSVFAVQRAGSQLTVYVY